MQAQYSASLIDVSPSDTLTSCCYSCSNVISAEFDHKLNLGDSTCSKEEEEVEQPTTECNCQQEDDNDDDDDDEDDDDDDDYEFSFVCGGDGPNSPISADDIFQNGKIKPIFPLFGVEQIRDLTPPSSTKKPAAQSNDKEEVDDEAEGIAYCLWSRNHPPPVESCRKSNSTGFSKLRRFRELLLLQRSQSDGKDAFFFLTEKRGGAGERKGKETKTETETVSSSSSSSSTTCQGKKKKCSNLESNCHRCTSEEKQKKPMPYYYREKSKTSSSSSMQRRKIKKSSLAPYGRSSSSNNNGGNGGEKRRSYLPYRQDLVGFFTSASTISRNVHPY